MLERTLEPEVMESAEEAAAYDAMDHRAVNTLFVDDLLAQNPPEGEYLDIGTGSARIPIELCSRQAETETRVVAVDLSINMLEVARINVEIASLMDQILLGHIDAKQLPYESRRFLVVMSNSIVHHIPEPKTVVAEAVRVTSDDGLLFFRDLMRPRTIGELDDLVEMYAGEESDHAQKMFADSLHAALSLEEMRDLVSELGFTPETVQATSDRHWTWAARRT